MPFAIELHEDPSVVVAVCDGVFDVATFECYLDEMESLGPFRIGTDLLVVFQDSVRVDLDSNAIMAGAGREMVFSPGATRVIVANDRLVFGLSRMFASFCPSASSRYRVVESLSSAARELEADEIDLKAVVDKTALQLAPRQAVG